MSSVQPGCDCGARWGARHDSECSALAPQKPPSDNAFDRMATAANEFHQGRQKFKNELAGLGVDIDD